MVSGDKAVTAPVRRAWHGAAVPIACLDGSEAGLERGSAFDGLALRRRPRPELRRARTAREIRGRLGGIERRRRALDAHLPLELGPEEKQGGGGVRRELASLAAMVVREEGEAAGVEHLEEDDAGRGPAVGTDGGERHRVGLVQLRFRRLGEPVLELPVGIGRDIRLVERLAHVLGAEVGDVHSGRMAHGRAPPAAGAAAIARFYLVRPTSSGNDFCSESREALSLAATGRRERRTEHQHEGFQRHGRVARPRASDMAESQRREMWHSVAPDQTAAPPPLARRPTFGQVG